MKFAILILSLFISAQAMAVTIEFPEEELARESVLPVFENATAVKSRLVPTKGRFELGAAMGFAMNEPFFKTSRFGGLLGYHFTETHAVVLMGQVYSSGLGDNGSALANTDLNKGSGTTYVRMQYAPQPKYHFFANYQITPYYGKISVFKDFVMNLSLYGLFGLGVVDIGGETTPALNVGIGQKFYFSKRWGIRADLGLMAYKGVNFFANSSGGTPSPIEDTGTSVNSAVPVSAFDRQMNYNMHFSVALIFLI